jgi:hypothetical protein
MKYLDARLLIMSKAPDPGQVKTRLIPLLGAGAAAELYAGLVHNCLAMSTAAGLCPVELWCTPSTGHPFFRHCQADYPVSLHCQPAGDLGQRMSAALQAALQRSRHAILIGADCPALSAADLGRALELLARGSDIVLGPAVDGGYYLIGMNTHHGFVFEDMPWSSAAVLQLTEQRLQQQGLQWQRLGMRRDLDTADDYRAWMASAPDLPAPPQ